MAYVLSSLLDAEYLLLEKNSYNLSILLQLMMDKYLNLNQKDLKLVIFRFRIIHLVQVSLDASLAFYFEENYYQENKITDFCSKI